MALDGSSWSSGSGHDHAADGAGRVIVPNLLTVDLEDWFHICEVDRLLPRESWDALPSCVESHTELLLELLQRRGAHATFFVLGYVAARYPALIRQIRDQGHEIAYHGWDHELVYDLEPKQFRTVLKRGVEAIGELVGVRPLGYRAPQWSINGRSLWALEVLAEEGFRYDSSMAPLKFVGDESFPHRHHEVSTPSGTLLELPPFTVSTPWGRYPAGGGWGLRCIPYGMLRRQIKAENDRNSPATFYIHPRELGPCGSLPGLPFRKRFVLSARIWSTRSQVNRLLSEFGFTSIQRWLEAVAP